MLLGLSACSQEPPPEIVHWQQAERASETAAFIPPATLPAALASADAWKPVALPDSRPRQPEVEYAGGAQPAQADVIWWRLTLPESARAGDDVHLYLPRWQTVGTVAVYADNRLIYRTSGSLLWNSFNRPLWLSLSQGEGGDMPHTVLIRMASERGLGGAISSVWAGPAEDLMWRYRARAILQVDLVVWSSVTFVAVGIFSLAVFWARRHEKIYLVFFMMAILYMLRYLHMTIGELPPPVPDNWFGWMTINALGWMALCIFLFLMWISRREWPMLEKSLIVGGILVTIATTPIVDPHLLTPATLPYAYGAALMLLAVLAIIGIRAARASKSRTAWILAAIYGSMPIIGLYDMAFLDYHVNIESVYLRPYPGIGLIVICAGLIYHRYISSLKAVEGANALLAKRVAEREAELSEKYTQLNQLQQHHALAQERQRIMQEMHDGLGSSLISALHMVERGTPNRDEIAQVLRACIDDLKLALDSLSIAESDLLALLATLRFRLNSRLQAAGIALQWNIAEVPPLPWLDTQSALHILRILQEVLANIIKHTQANRIEFSTRCDTRDVIVEVRDNGHGTFTHPTAETPSFPGRGLTNIANRATAIGATCAWETTPEGGLFTLRLPLERAKA
jgi:signal transduction histidine kinase